jgi:hypothetical protein
MGGHKKLIKKDAMLLIRLYEMEKEQFQQIAEELIQRDLIGNKTQNSIL